MTLSISRIGMYKYQIKEEIDDVALYSATRHIEELIKYIEMGL
jgi:hypothetical protein